MIHISIIFRTLYLKQKSFEIGCLDKSFTIWWSQILQMLLVAEENLQFKLRY